ncbi:hypothetical protein ACWCV5_28255 [Streptomyces tubercidicus]
MSEIEASESGEPIEGTVLVKGSEIDAVDDAGLPDLPGDAPADGAEIEPHRGGRIADVIGDAFTFLIVISRLALAAVAMRCLSEAVKGAYDYVEDCARTVDNLADIAASLHVDASVTSAHHDAAAVMRETLAEAESLSSEAAEMATEFDNAAHGHEDDYGTVNEAMQTGDADVADREYYSNR